MRYVLLLSACFGLSCVGTSFAGSTVKPGNPKYWEDVCRKRCVESDMELEAIEYKTGKRYKIRVAIVNFSKGQGCECGERDYNVPPDKAMSK